MFPHSVFITNEYKYEAKKYAHDIHCHGNHCHGNHCHDNQLTVRGMILSANISQTTQHSIHNLSGHWRVGTHVKTIQPCDGGSLVPRLSPCANKKPKEREEPGIIYHVRNAMGRETLIRCGRVNELAHTLLTE